MSSSPVLTIMKEGEVLQTCFVDGDILLGRSKECAIALDDRAISRQHALFKMVGAQVQVEKKSEFGSLFLNGAECTLAVLKEGDLITAGPYMIRLSAGESQNQTPSPSVAAPKAALSPAPAETLDAGVLEVPGGSSEGFSPAITVEDNSIGIGLGVDNIENAAAPVDGSDNPVSSSEQSGLNVALNMDSSSDANSPSDGQNEGASGGEEILDLGGQINFDSPINEEPSNSQIVEIQVPEASELIGEDAKTKVSPSTKLIVKLVFPEGKANFKEYEITRDEISIGRGKDCDIVLEDKKSSRKNAIIRRAGVRFIIKDLDSANGTYVNGEKIAEKELSGDDLIRIGGVEFRFKAISADYAAKEKEFMSLPEEISTPEIDPAAPQMSPIEGMDQANMGVVLEGQEEQPVLPGLATAGVGAPMNGMGDPAISGIAGISGGTVKKGTLIEKFRALPKRTQLIGGVAALLLLAWLMEDEPVTVKKQIDGPKKVATAPAADKGPLTFESLSTEQKRFVEAQHNLAFDYYKNKEYDKAIFEVEKIFVLIADYKDSREIQRYARAGKQKLEAIEEERKKKEEEAALKKKIAQLVEETRERMEKKDYEQAKELFSQVLAIDPDNAQVAAWRKEIEAYEEQLRLDQQQKQVQVDINKHAWNIFKEGMDLKKAKKYHSAIGTFQKVSDIGASDPKLLPLSKKMIVECRATIRNLRDPVLSQAKEQESAGEFAKAFQLYKKATRIDPPHPAGYAGMNRIRSVLHEKAKAIYTEAILAEGFSDFVTAKKLFKECVAVAPEDDIYYERAQRKLVYYFRKDEAAQQ